MTVRLGHLALCSSVTAIAIVSCSSSSLPTFGPAVRGEAGVPSRLARNPTGGYNVVFSFDGSNGFSPYGDLAVRNGTLYGTTAYGGSSNACFAGCGVIFGVTPSGAESTLHEFARFNWGRPRAGLTSVGGILYGTTTGVKAKPGKAGTFFSLKIGDDKFVERYGFRGGDDGAFPYSDLTYVDGTFYGTTAGGGAGDAGTVFSVTPTGEEKVLYSFKGGSDGAAPRAGLTYLNGTFYGTTSGDGAVGFGTVFSVTEAGEERVLYSFKGGSDGAIPLGRLTVLHGELFGTTASGGSDACRRDSYRCGTIFKITTSGKETVLYSFKGRNNGGVPTAGLTILKGTLYGTTSSGGSDGCANYAGCGVIFGVTPTGKEHVAHVFTGQPDGELPNADLTNFNGTLYGTTTYGGADGAGMLFAFTP